MSINTCEQEEPKGLREKSSRQKWWIVDGRHRVRAAEYLGLNYPLRKRLTAFLMSTSTLRGKSSST
jgi:ParB-like chromosome segregation protein Spo0J